MTTQSRWHTRALDVLRQDVGFAVRALRRTPGFSAAIVVTLALGIGANAAIFSLADRLFVRPPTGVSDPSSLRRLYVRSNWTVGGVWEIRSGVGYQAFVALDSGLAPRVPLAAYTKPDTMSMGYRGAVTTVHGSFATATYLPLLGVRPAIGRFYSADEDVMGAGVPVAVISYALWQRRFAGDARVLGKAIDIAHQPYTIVGVAAKRFAGADLDATDVWLPLGTFPARPIGDEPWFHSWRSGNFLRVLGRVTPGTSDAWISAVSTTVLRRGELAGVSRGPDTTATVLPGPLLESLAPSIKPAPEVAITTRLVGVTAIVLLIACANVANLLLSRALSRRREIAVRLALGISQRRLVMQLLTESVVLALAGGVAAIVVGDWAGAALRAMVLPGTQWAEPVLSLRVLLFTGAAALLTGVAAGLAPALRASRPELTSALKTGTRDGGAFRSRLRTALIVAQVSLSVVLLYGAGLFVRSLSSVSSIDLGYDTDRLIFGTVNFVNPDGRYIERTPHMAELSTGLEAAATRLASMPGVEGTALATAPPMAGYAMIGLYLQGGAEPPRLNDLDPALISVTPSYFATTGLRLLRGRLFTDADASGPPVTVVNETTARTFWPGRDALGQCVILFRPTQPCVTVVGIVEDSHRADVVEQPTVMLFTPIGRAEAGSLRNASYLIVRASPDRAAAVAAAVRGELRRTLPNAEPPWVRPMASLLEPELRPWRLGASLFSAFGVLALVVAAVGVYSVIAYSVSQRVHEMSVRVALGARPADLVLPIIGQGVGVVIVGVALGTAIALALGRLVGSLLYGTTPHDPVVGVAVGMMLVLSALVATAVPAWRASRADPLIALRTE